KKAAMQSIKNTWFGLAMDPKSGRVWWSAGGGDGLHTYTWADGKLTPGAFYPPPEKIVEEPKPAEPKPTEPKPAEPKKDPPSTGFRTGLHFDNATGALYSLTIIPKSGG